MTAATANTVSLSWYEASARQRIDALVDAGSFREFIGPELRERSPHLSIFDLPEQFDDGIVVGGGRVDGSPVLVAAQEGRFMGGAFGEVHGAKLTGLLRAARRLQQDVLILFDTGGVRLQEANAGELAIAEIMRAVIEARRAGVNVIGLIGGRAGCYGGGSLIAGTCSRLIVSEQGRISVSGPEVIETNRGIEEFDFARSCAGLAHDGWQAPLSHRRRRHVRRRRGDRRFARLRSMRSRSSAVRLGDSQGGAEAPRAAVTAFRRR